MTNDSLSRDPFNSLKLAPFVLVASLGLLSACSSSNDAATDMGRKGPKVKVTPSDPSGSTGGSTTTTTTPPPATTATVTYDTSIGNGVDAAGFADLPLRAGAHRYFVSSAAGSDSNSCSAATAPTAPKATIVAAIACVANGAGDQVLVAQGTSYSAALPNMTDKSGADPVHPTVIESYDPADALNEAKYGRASNGSRPVIAGGNSNFAGGPGTSVQYLAIRGFELNSGNRPDLYMSFVPNTYGQENYILIENNIFRYISLIFDQALSSTTAQHLVIRGNSFVGQWSATDTAQGLYLSTVNYTLEDNVFWHNGWKVGASRDDDISIGGLNGGTATMNHPVYAQYSSNGVARRNLTIDGAADGGSYRGDILFTENVGIDNPIAIGLGGGWEYATHRPGGVMLEASYNAFIGDADISSTNKRGWGMSSQDGKLGSSFHHNLIARSRNAANSPAAFSTSAGYDVPSYMDFHDNRIYQWVTSGKTISEGGDFPLQVHATYNNNIWDDPASGTNLNDASASWSHPYTAADLYAALGFASKQALIDYAIEHPEAHIQRTARTMLLAGYGLN